MPEKFTQNKTEVDTSKSPNVKLKPISMGDCKWTEGFWAEKTKLCEESMLSLIHI